MASIKTKFAIILQMVVCSLAFIRASEPVGRPAEEIIRSPSKLPIVISEEDLCPVAEDILPCICYSDITLNSIVMDCSQVQNEDELENIFSQEFPVTNFTRLEIDHNQNLTVIQEGDLGVYSFTSIDIGHGILEKVDDLALMGSYDTLEELFLWGNYMQSVPDISLFTKMIYVNVMQNSLTSIPTLNSTTLETLYLSANDIKTIPVDAFVGLPSLKDVSLYDNDISHIVAGTFTNIPQLYYVDLSGNNLTVVREGSFEFHGDSTFLYLQNNNINHIQPNSFSGVTTYMYVNGNSLVELEEEVFRPLLEAKVSVNLAERAITQEAD